MNTRKPQWMLDFREETGFWPIAGGSTSTPPPEPQPDPQGNQQQAGTVTIEDPPAEPQQQQQPTAPPQQPPAPQSQPQGQGQRTPTWEDVERARKEEKDKLYPRIEEMQSELQKLREAKEEERRQQEEQEKKAEEARKRKEEEEMEVRELLNKKEQEWNNRFQQIEQERERERAILERERELHALEQYARRRLSEEQDEIMPELRDMLVGPDGSVKAGSQEEVDQMVEDLKARTNQILQQVSQTQQQQRQQMQGTRPTAPPAGPMEEHQSGQRSFSAQDIHNMPMSEYVKHRDKLMGAAKQRAQEGGLYQ